ncbi:hypothetical protein MCGE09_00637 [Thaumarchaeota archaeon SCGC AB-539-E09]|nr:hypothetical protein MCGE09_00637 [Thaumarchaeota archaeon SCGC AB-539-E09]
MTNNTGMEVPDGNNPLRIDKSYINIIYKFRFRVSKRHFTILTMIIFTLSCVLDHLTTAYGVTLFSVVESNPMVIMLMDFGIWHEFELMVISVGILQIFVTYFIRSNVFFYYFSNSLMIFAGLVRYYSALHNVTVIMTALF